MKRTLLLSVAVFVFTTGLVSADTFGTGANQFEIDFVPISGDSGDLGSWSAGPGYTFSGVNHSDYRMGIYEITNDQWNKFNVAYGTVTGTPSSAYDNGPIGPVFSGSNVPINRLSWYEAAQFVNWLNTSKGYQAAYKFTGAQGTGDYTLSVWDVTEADGSNLYRHKDAHYFMPTEGEWVKAAYWNGTSLQTYASVGDVSPTQSGWNYYAGRTGTDPVGPWDVGSGSQELNGTFDMMGNVWEWMEGPYNSGNYLPGTSRNRRGGSYYYRHNYLSSSDRFPYSPGLEHKSVGFRVASVPESTITPVTLDIKPTSCPNPLNVKSKGVLPIAILGTEAFDVSTIDPASVRLNEVEPIRSSLEDVATPLSDPNECECTTNGPDGFTDLTLKFKTQDIVESIGEVDRDDVLTLPLTGVLYDGTPVEGADCIVIKGRHKPINIADVNEDGVVNVLDMTIFAQNWLESSIVDD